MLKAGLLALLTSAAAVAPALAWDDQGHMMVAAVAYDKLTPPTKARVAALPAAPRQRMGQYRFVATPRDGG